ncbi:MAG: hypothetical protein EOM67_04350 [Spirochaetia bacterium]|nr:hypothetical protein [Spirochaetia bacterium]
MSFTMPQDFVATSYTLQFSDSNSPYNFVTMTNYLDKEYTTENPLASGYSVPIPTPHLDGYFRLKINGGTYDGQYSNIIYATQCAVDADVNWSLDYSMFNTGTMSPYVGFGIVADFTLVDSDDGDIEDGLTYEWFRVNPNDFEDSEVIVGQTDLTYTTTDSDIDHYILVVATGTDEKFSGGLCWALLDFVVTR